MRLPVAHVERVRDDARARLQLLLQLRNQLQIERRQQVQRDHGRLADVGREQILIEEFHLVADAAALQVLGRFLDALRIDVDADAARAVRLGAGDRNAAVARAEVVDDVALVTFATLSIASTTSCGVGTKMTSGAADGCRPDAAAGKRQSKPARTRCERAMRNMAEPPGPCRDRQTGNADYSYPARRAGCQECSRFEVLMSVIVQKYGGSSVADVDKLRHVAERVMRTREPGHDVVVVVSAMGDTTDELLALAKQVSPNPDRRELDMLLSAGERISMALLSMAIRELGGDAISFTGSQSGIITNDRHVDARIIEVRPFRVQDELARGKIVVIAGYQGVSYRREVTTLGRGGSDTTAVAMAAALGAEYCEICSDVDGVYTADPRVVPAARRIGTLSYEETQEMAESGAKVLNAQAVEFAKEKGIAIYARATQRAAAGRRSVSRRHGRPAAPAADAGHRRRRRQRARRARARGRRRRQRRARAARRAPRRRQAAAHLRRPYHRGHLAREPARRGATP